MGEYDPKSKGIPVSWRGMQRRFPKILSTFHIAILAGFVSLLILRSTIGFSSFKFAGHDSSSSMDEYEAEARLRSLDIELDVEPKRNLVQTAEHEIEKIHKEVKKKAEQEFPEDHFDDLVSTDLLVDDPMVVAKVLPEPTTVKVVKVLPDPEPKTSKNDRRVGAKPEVVEDFKQVEAQLAEEETVEELAEFEKFEKDGEKGKRRGKAEQTTTAEDLGQKVDLSEGRKLKLGEPKPNERKPMEEKLEEAKAVVMERGINRKPAEESNITAVQAESEALSVELLQIQAVENMTKAIRRDEPGAFTLGPKVSDWDEQRAEWLDAHPEMKTTDPHKPKVLLLTGSQPWPCRSAVGDHYLLKMIKNKVDYARIHRMQIFYNFAHLDQPMSHVWAKLPLIRKMMLIHPEMEWIFWMDSDAMFTDMVFEIPFENYENYNLVMWGYEGGLYDERSWVACNTGVFFLRNNQWTLDLLEEWSHMGPEGAVRVEVGKILTSYLTRRPELDADDQSALVYLLLTRPELRSGVLLEDEFFLSGYWVDLVGRYEKYSETSRPGAGGRDWPFTTHFTGCQPCTGLSNELYEGTSCLDGMERAFNFADNQILRPFGFEHESLHASVVRRIRNETTTPLWSVPIGNPWSVESFY